MSGGSFDYLYRKMEDGDVLAFMRSADEMVAEMRRLIERLRAGEGMVWEAAGVYGPYKNTEVAIISLEALCSRFTALKGRCAAVQQDMMELSPMAHSIEWKCSGDTGDDDVCDDAVAWLRAKVAWLRAKVAP